MYTKDGKPIIPDYGRKNPGVNRQEFEALKTDFIKLKDEFEALKAESKTVDVDIEALKAEAIALGIEVKGNWGAKRIASAIEDAKAPKD